LTGKAKTGWGKVLKHVGDPKDEAFTEYKAIHLKKDET